MKAILVNSDGSRREIEIMYQSSEVIIIPANKLKDSSVYVLAAEEGVFREVPFEVYSE